MSYASLQVESLWIPSISCQGHSGKSRPIFFDQWLKIPDEIGSYALRLSLPSGKRMRGFGPTSAVRYLRECHRNLSILSAGKTKTAILFDIQSSFRMIDTLNLNRAGFPVQNPIPNPVL